MSKINTDKMHYLGDGLYADYDGLGFNLVAPRDGGDHWCYVEPQVMEALLRFVGEKWGGKFTFAEVAKGE